MTSEPKRRVVVRSADYAARHPTANAALSVIRSRADGWLEFRDQRGNEYQWLPLCSPLKVLALTRDAEGRSWGMLLEVHDPDGRQHLWAMPAAKLANWQRDGFREQLYDLGCRIEPGLKAARALHRYLSSTVDMNGNELPHFVAASRSGWHGRDFVLPGGAIGGVGLVFQSSSAVRAAIRTAGTLQSWHKRVAEPAANNSRCVLAISAAFAAPLLGPLQFDGAVLHLRGPSSIGKSTILDVAGSVWGGGGLNGFRQSWQATANGIEAMAEAHCDILLCLDELSLVGAEDAARIAYQLASGTGRQRALANG